MGHVEMDPQAANRWRAVEVKDANTCQPCLDNNGKLYKNRADAYADYPDGKGYINCVGAQYGNKCRGEAVKRKGEAAQVTPELLATVEIMRARERHLSFRGAAGMPASPQQGFRVVPAVRALSPDTQTGAGGTATKMYLYDAIGGCDGIAALDVIDALDTMTGDLELHINSPGGSIFEGTAIYHALANYDDGRVHGRVDGIAGSIASTILMACDDIVCEPGAQIMVHDGSGGAYGTEQEILAFAAVLGQLSQSMAGIYAARTGGTPEQWRTTMRAGDTWYNAQAAVDAGLATSVGGAIRPTLTPAPAAVLELDGLFELITAAVRPQPTSVPAAHNVEGLRTTLKGLFA